MKPACPDCGFDMTGYVVCPVCGGWPAMVNEEDPRCSMPDGPVAPADGWEYEE